MKILSKSQFFRLALIYVNDCNVECENCPLGVAATEHATELPGLPLETTVCDLFDYIAKNIPSYRQGADNG